jgi:hypothetical protein
MSRNAVAQFVLITVGCFHTVSANAQPQIDGEKFQKYLNSDAHGALVGKTYASVPKAIFESCKNIVSKGSNSIPLSIITFGADGNPATGSWKQQFPLEACGEKIVLNFYFIARDGTINDTVGAPGDSHASLLLQHDTVMYAQMGAMRKMPDCKTLNIKNTRFEGFGTPDVPDPGPNAKFRPWWETWTMIGCGQTVEVPIIYQPDATGTTIIQRSK